MTNNVWILSAAKAHLETHGWKRGGLGWRGEPCCIVGAISVAACGDATTESGPAAWGAIGAVKMVLKVSNLTGWNDAPERTKEDVLAAIQMVIDEESK